MLPRAKRGVRHLKANHLAFHKNRGMKMWNYCILLSMGVSHFGLAKKYHKAKKKKRINGDSNISPCKNIIFKKSFKRL
jgi:hypothetical protein